MEWTAVTFTTPEYERFAPLWEEMIRSLGGTPIITRLSSTGNWARNTGLKPSAILDAWRHVTTPWFLYLDIDTRILSAPSLPEGNWEVGVTDNRELRHKNRISAADLIFKRTAGSLRFLQHWQLRCRARPGKDHDQLTHTITTFKATNKAVVQDITGAIDWQPNGLREPHPSSSDSSSDAVILFKYPSRGRPDRFFRSLDSIVNNLANTACYHVACTLDTDDEEMNNTQVRERIAKYENVSVQWGLSESKIHAVNRDFPDLAWDIIINMSDDMVFTRKGFDNHIRNEMQAAFPANDGLLHFPDNDAGARLATLYIAGKGFYDRFGYIYHPGFKSLWCDNLVQEIAQALGKYHLLDYGINQHLNPAYGHAPKDPMFVRQQKDWNHDKNLYLQIKARGYDLSSLQP